MAVSWTDVVAIAPELASVVTASQTKFLAMATRQVDPDIWGEFTDDGITYLAAHLASLAGNQAGAVSSESIGPMSRSYGGGSINAEGSFALSTYGAEYERLQKIVAAPAAMLVP